jgi:two-component system LytT family response regulator
MENRLRVILLDDELHALGNLSEAIHQVDSDIVICGQFTDPIEAILYVKNNPIDVFFIDISMPLMDGFEVLRRIGDFIAFKTVFVTAYSEYVLQAFKQHAFDYLLKPINISELHQCIMDCKLVQKRLKKDNKIVLQSSEKIHFVKFEDIIYLQADNSYTKFVLKEKSVLTSKPISHFSNLLDPIIFFRCHNSFLVNKSHILEYHKKNKSLLLINKDEIPVSRSKKEELFL